jgi:hypothetical protein
MSDRSDKSISQLICQNLINRSSFYNPSFSTSVFILNKKPFLLNVVDNTNKRRPILKLSEKSPDVLYLYSPQRHTRVPFHKHTFQQAILQDENYQIAMQKSVENLINSD